MCWKVVFMLDMCCLFHFYTRIYKNCLGHKVHLGDNKLTTFTGDTEKQKLICTNTCWQSHTAGHTCEYVRSYGKHNTSPLQWNVLPYCAVKRRIWVSLVLFLLTLSMAMVSACVRNNLSGMGVCLQWLQWVFKWLAIVTLLLKRQKPKNLKI